MSHERATSLLAFGQSIWQDDISRNQLTSGFLQRMVDEVGIRGVTSNPTIFEKAIAAGSDYDEQIASLLDAGKSALEIFEAVEVDDIRDACDVLRPVYDASDGADGFVSIEVSPDAARNADSTREQVRRLWDAVDRPNLMVKIPGTAEGLPVIREMLAEGKNINITLLFSIDSYRAVAEAYVSALEERSAKGQPIDRIASVASFFVSRVDTLVDKLLDEKANATTDPKLHDIYAGLKGTIAVANAQLAYGAFLEIFDGPRWDALAAAGARPQRPLWASTGTKNPDYSDTLYVDTLIGPHTVNTMPGKTIEAFLDHGAVSRTVDADLEGARQLIAELETTGIDLKAVTDQLEQEGIASFVKSFESLLAGVESKRAALAGR
ncbi:MAG: transaldolase [Thermomicrobiales bacterium]|nr:transaldolase [Thermomicrobiales bacterium]